MIKNIYYQLKKILLIIRKYNKKPIKFKMKTLQTKLR